MRILTDSMLLKAQYELEEFQPEDNGYEIVQVIINDESANEYTHDYLTAKLNEWSQTLSGKALLEKFIRYITAVMG